MNIFKTIICLVVFFAIGPKTINAQEGHEKSVVLDSILIDGIWRTFEYHIPQFPVDNSRLLFVLHGDAMTSGSMQTVTGFEYNKLADRTGTAIVVYPQGYKNYWNDCRKEASFDTKNKDVNDIVFIKNILQRMERRYHINRENVFAVGYFNGGNMCYKLAKTTPHLFKGFAVIGANLSSKSNNDCPSDGKPVSIMIINDVADSLNPYAGGESISNDGFTRGNVQSTKKTLEYWLSLLQQRDQLPLSKVVSTIEKANSMVSRYDYYSKENNKSVSLLKITKGGYPFPNPHVDQLPLKTPFGSKYINIPETVMRFFYQAQYSNPDYSNQ